MILHISKLALKCGIQGDPGYASCSQVRSGQVRVFNVHLQSKGVRAVRLESVAGGGWFEVL